MRIIRIIITALLACSVVCEVQAEDDYTLIRQAHRGNVAAMRKIGIRMYKGACSVSGSDPSVGLQWIEKAADRGDGAALYFLGGVYLGKGDKERGEEYMRKAADRGNSKAAAYLSRTEKEGAREALQRKLARISTAFGIDSGSIPSVQNAVKDAVDIIKKGTQKANVSQVAMVEFLCNGGKSNDLSDTVRDKFQEALVNGATLEVTDRLDTKMLMQEGAGQDEMVDLQASTAVFMGEVIAKVGEPVGYLAYRIFHVKTMHIIAAGFVPIKWNTNERRLLEETSLGSTVEALPFSTKKELDEKVGEIKSRVKCGIAMVHDGTVPEENTIEDRVAFAQILAAMYAGGCDLYEREFFVQAAKEAAVSGDIATAEKVGALGAVKLTQSSGRKNELNIKITSYPRGSLLSVVNLKQERGVSNN